MVRRALVLCLVAAAALPAAAAGKVSELVVFRDGAFKEKSVSPKRTTVRVGGRRCAVPASTPLAALVAGRPARIGFRDFGSCSRRARDAAGLFVKSIGSDVNGGGDGW